MKKHFSQLINTSGDPHGVLSPGLKTTAAELFIATYFLPKLKYLNELNLRWLRNKQTLILPNILPKMWNLSFLLVHASEVNWSQQDSSTGGVGC